MKTLIKNGTLYVKGDFIKANLVIEDKTIKAIGTDISKADKIIDAQDMLVAPGLIDVHVHYREPGFTNKETIKTGSLAAAKGGYTTVCAMPNLKPVPDTAKKLTDQIKLNKEKGLVHIKQYGAITKDLISDELVDYSAMKQAGAFGFSNDGHGVQQAGVMYKAMKECAAINLPICAHIEDESLLDHGVMNAGAKSDELGLKGMNVLSETSQLARDLLLAKQTKVHYHACHISTADSIELIKIAKNHGINVTCEATPHHLLLNEEDVKLDDSNYKMNPPLRSKKDQQALLGALADGTIDMIATDHAPHAAIEKGKNFVKAAFGITGSETAFSMIYTKLVKTQKIISLSQMLDLMSQNPAEKFNMNAGKIEPKMPADLAIFDLNHEFEIKVADFASKGKNNPFIGQKVYGQTVMTIVNGKVVYKR